MLKFLFVIVVIVLVIKLIDIGIEKLLDGIEKDHFYEELTKKKKRRKK